MLEAEDGSSHARTKWIRLCADRTNLFDGLFELRTTSGKQTDLRRLSHKKGPQASFNGHEGKGMER